MPSINIDFVEELKSRGASQRDIAYAAANIPEEFWDVSRDEIEVTKTNNAVYKYVLDYVDDIENMMTEGKGLSMIGEGKQGKTLFGCAILKSIALNPRTMRRDYKVLRVNYDTIIEDFIHIRHEQDTYAELRNVLTRADILFIDSISFTTPPSVLISILRTRRDFKKATILATNLNSTVLAGLKSKEMFSIFDDVNKTYLVKRK